MSSDGNVFNYLIMAIEMVGNESVYVGEGLNGCETTETVEYSTDDRGS